MKKIENNQQLDEIVYRMKRSEQTEDVCECIVCGSKKRAMYNGVCVTCILDTVDYDTALNWLTTYNDIDTYEDVTHIEGLMLCKWLGLDKYDMPSASTRAIKEMLLMEYRRQRAEDQMTGNGFLREIKAYIKNTALDDYARYIISIAKKAVGE